MCVRGECLQSDVVTLCNIFGLLVWAIINYKAKLPVSFASILDSWLNATDPSAEWWRKVLVGCWWLRCSSSSTITIHWPGFARKALKMKKMPEGERYVKLESGRCRYRSIVVHGVVGYGCGTGCELMISRCGPPTDGVISSSSSFCVHSACYMAY